MKKYFFLFIICFLMWSGLAAGAAAAEFKDIDSKHPFYDEMIYLKNEGIISGFTDGTFRPDERVTRANVAVMLGKALKLNGAKKPTPFKDVPSSHQASGYISSAVDAGIISGYSDGTFRPNEIVYRGQMAIFLARAFHLEVEAVVPFTDISSAMASYPYIKRLIAANLTAGYGDNTFRPNQKVTRAQFSAFLARGLNPAFKVEFPVQLSYQRNTSKVYHYEADFVGPHYYRLSDRKYEGWYLWDVYEGNVYSYSFLENENIQGYYIGYPDSEFHQLISYPIMLGKTWDGYGEMPDYYSITGTDLTVTTPAGTFHHVVAVSFEQVTEYFAPGAGTIKITQNGKTVSQLVRIE
ncbi:S-layer homology domain-containing protein [Bacillus benzoevorans]|uniref:SLH domain-containing protein n=1 Tax=Bacillus benzoevorans TaxID=1456 RepID=A0A7X0HSK9_9BACI|nr:S-layer homology domain-containing protein [Bacillus benzoevorans]MBB6446058.1 hypothetical protein [Bacillus benzoevorans]